MHKIAIETDIQELGNIIDSYLGSEVKMNYAIKIVGHPGIGKSSIVKEIAEKKNFFFIDTRLAFKENIDLGGYPVPDHENKKMIYYRPKFIPPEEIPAGYKGVLWFLDEANRAHPTVIQTLFQIITERRCGDHLLPENTSIVLAGNLGEEDSTSITDFDDAALDGRLAIFHLKPRPEDWLPWACRNNVHPSIIEYITMYPERLWDQIHINPNPRGWHQVSMAISNAYNLKTSAELKYSLMLGKKNTLEKVIAALVGEIAAHDFVSQIISPREISTEDIISGDMEKLSLVEQKNLPAEDILWAISGAISNLSIISENKKGDLSGKNLEVLKNILCFISKTRADTQISFFQIFLRECGALTKVPQAISLIEDEVLKIEVSEKFTKVFEED